ncbi:MAG: prephenate dehydrogenase/arogenate dehydrogenase family protein, partial [Alphaproteobacteria bacterium]
MTGAAKPLFARAALIGMGLIGSSLARVMRRENLAGHIAGRVRSEASRAKCLELGLADSMHDAPGDAVEGADLVVLCTPLGTYAPLAEA